MHLLQIFFSHRIQLLRQRVIKMLLYLGLSCFDCSFSEELSDAKINTRIHKVPDHGVDLNPGADPIPLGEGVTSTRVSLFGSVFGSLHNFISHCARDFMQGLGYTRSTLRGVNMPEDMAKREADHARNEKLRAQKQRRQA
jgi:hypothetical protein